MSLILEGFMGCGKSAIGRQVAARLGVPFIDTDSEIEKRQGCSISDIFEYGGEEAFRQMETSMLHGLELEGVDAVISLGGGTPVRAANVPVIKRLGKVVYLKAPAEVLIKRLWRGGEDRPMLRGGDLDDRVRSLLRDREGLYEEVADYIIDVSDEDMKAVCDRVMDAIGGKA